VFAVEDGTGMKETETEGSSPAERTTARDNVPDGSRRSFLAKMGVSAAALGATGCLGSDGPEEVAAEFVEAVADGRFRRADALLHAESPLDGAATAAEGATESFDASGALDAVRSSVTGTEVVRKEDGEATVDVTVEFDLVVTEVEGVARVETRTENGDWRVWRLEL